jgi:endoglucanase
MVVLDPHNYARYHGELVGSDAVPDSAFADFWRRLASEFVDDERVAFGLVNEPSELGDDGTENWLVSANAAIRAIRETGADNLVLVPGNAWSGGGGWTQDWYGTPNADVLGEVEDPANNFAFEVHQYLDEDSSGHGIVCVSENVGVERLAEVTEWARQGGFRLFLGEFGAAANPTCLRALEALLTYVGDNDAVWLGWTWWAAGPWWNDYPMSIEPYCGNDKPQMDLLERHLGAPGSR